MTSSIHEPSPSGTIPPRLVTLLAACCGLMAANIYYAQPLAGPIARAIGLPPAMSGLIVTLTQIGYCLGLLLLVPLADLVENRKLVVRLSALAAVALIALSCAVNAPTFLLATLLLGLFTVVVQILVPFAAHLAPVAIRGRVVGTVMGGLMLGIMAARPVSSLIAQFVSWRAVFVLAAIAVASMTLVLSRLLPERVPHTQQSYGTLLRSMVRLLAETRVLQRRAFYQACLFGAFSLFWTVTPLLLAGPEFQLSQGGIALFALVGISGSLTAPMAGRMADRGWTRPATRIALLAAAAAFAITWFAPHEARLLGLTVAAIVLDAGVTANLVLGQRALFVLADEHRGRLNGIYMALFFMGGALGSAVGGWAFATHGWKLASAIGCALPLLALAVCLTEKQVQPAGEHAR